MNKFYKHRMMVSAGIVSVFATCSAVEAKDASRPNVILILADDMGYGDVGYHNIRKMMTPNIDKLAADGVHFTQGYVSASVCGPSRSGLLTGVYQQRFGCGENPSATGFPGKMKFPLGGVPRSQKMISEMMKDQGYTTGMVGKWHLGVDVSLRPHARGYDFFYGFLNGSHSYVEWTNEFAKNKSKWPVFRNNEMEPASKDIYLTDLFSNEAVGFIEKNADKPFFLFASYNAVHHPWEATEECIKRTKSISDTDDFNVFSAMVLSMDDGIGRMVDMLKKKGIEDNTMIIFLTDNGSPEGQGLKHAKKDPNRERGGYTMSSTGDLRGYKGDTYEGGTKVPFLIKWPGKIKAGTKYELPVSALDIVPTVLKGCSDTNITDNGFDGVDLLPYLSGKMGDKRPHDVMYWRRDNDYAIRKGDWKLTWNDTHGTTEVMLFNLATDPNETKNVAKQHPEMAQNLQDQFDAWDSQMPDNEWWGGPWNRNRTYSKGNRVDVVEFNQEPPTGSEAHKKVRNTPNKKGKKGKKNRK
jgi:arylsulfatase A-like enzyme